MVPCPVTAHSQCTTCTINNHRGLLSSSSHLIQSPLMMTCRVRIWEASRCSYWHDSQNFVLGALWHGNKFTGQWQTRCKISTIACIEWSFICHNCFHLNSNSNSKHFVTLSLTCFFNELIFQQEQIQIRILGYIVSNFFFQLINIPARATSDPDCSIQVWINSLLYYMPKVLADICKICNVHL